VKLHRKPVLVATAGLVVVSALVGSVVLLALNPARAATTAPSPSAAGSVPVVSATPAATATTAATARLSPGVSGGPSAAPSASPSTRSLPLVRESFVAPGTEPSIAADPFHAGVVAVVSENMVMTAPRSGCSRPAVRISKDGGATWAAPVYPWRGQCQDVHAIVAWGPNSRLYVADAVGGNGGVVLSISHSDDLGKTWSVPFVEPFTKGWSGCFPALTVDNWPDSPNFGVVYAAYNWLPNNYGPAVAVIASRDGDNWAHTEVELDTAPDYPYSWRIGYRIQAAPDGTALVSFYESQLKSWNPANILYEGPADNIGQMGFQVARVHLVGTKLSADKPYAATSTDHTEAQWQSQLAIDDSGMGWLAVENGDRIDLGRLDGRWREFAVKGKTNFKPSLAVSGRTIFLGWHASDDDAMIRTYYSISYDAGATFTSPALISDGAWNMRQADVVNNVGLRENADFRSGVVYYAYGDARSGLSIYVAVIKP
jgi:hypothetical protein